MTLHREQLLPLSSSLIEVDELAPSVLVIRVELECAREPVGHPLRVMQWCATNRGALERVGQLTLAVTLCVECGLQIVEELNMLRAILEQHLKQHECLRVVWLSR